MTTLDGRPHSALLLIDVQNAVVGEAFERDRVVSTISGLVDRAHVQGVPIIWVRHADEQIERGTDGWQIVPELVPAPGDIMLEKGYADSFEATDLEAVLVDRGSGA